MEVKNRGDCAHRCSKGQVILTAMLALNTDLRTIREVWNSYLWRKKWFHFQLFQKISCRVSSFFWTSISEGCRSMHLSRISFAWDQSPPFLPVMMNHGMSVLPLARTVWQACWRKYAKKLALKRKLIIVCEQLESRLCSRLMFQSKSSRKKTGHKSLQALRCYERVSAEQHREVSKLLMPAQPSSVTTDLVQPGPERTTGDLGKQIGGFFNCLIGSFCEHESHLFKSSSWCWGRVW